MENQSNYEWLSGGKSKETKQQAEGGDEARAAQFDPLCAPHPEPPHPTPTTVPRMRITCGKVWHVRLVGDRNLEHDGLRGLRLGPPIED